VRDHRWNRWMSSLKEFSMASRYVFHVKWAKTASSGAAGREPAGREPAAVGQPPCEGHLEWAIRPRYNSLHSMGSHAPLHSLKAHDFPPRLTPLLPRGSVPGRARCSQ
jgi:hypothetical protein